MPARFCWNKCFLNIWLSKMNLAFKSLPGINYCLYIIRESRNYSTVLFLSLKIHIGLRRWLPTSPLFYQYAILGTQHTSINATQSKGMKNICIWITWKVIYEPRSKVVYLWMNLSREVSNRIRLYYHLPQLLDVSVIFRGKRLQIFSFNLTNFAEQSV